MEQTHLKLYSKIWGTALGIFLFLIIHFLGIPIILENPQLLSPEANILSQVSQKYNFSELFGNIPNSAPWAVALLLLILLALPLVQKQNLSAPLTKWILGCGVFWIFWVILSSSQTIASSLSFPTTIHLASCIACFFIGFFILNSDNSILKIILFFSTFALLEVLLFAFQQHYGGLEETRKMILSVYSPDQLPEDLLRRINSNRVYGSMVYPNSLAGIIILLLPPCLCALWELPDKVPSSIRLLLVGTLGYMGIASLYWSRSKTAWLIVILLLCFSLFLKIKLSLKYKSLIIIGILVISLTGFGLVFSDYFKRGATSLGARFDYWTAAVLNIRENPLMGSGPGTFAIPYQNTKSPESEMARLCHNDYLEQATDSGLPAGISYLLFISGNIILIWSRQKHFTSIQLSLALGVTAFALQGVSEFSLYIPAIAWPFFILLGFMSHSCAANYRLKEKKI